MIKKIKDFLLTNTSDKQTVIKNTFWLIGSELVVRGLRFFLILYIARILGAVGENIGIEINGKNEPFSRPVFIYRKLSRFGFMSVPLSTKIKNGSWYVDFVFQDKKITANLAQARVMSSQRLYNKQGELSAKDTKRIKDAFIKLYS